MSKGRYYALTAIFLWATLAGSAVYLKHIPPLFQLGVAFIIGGLPALWSVHREWKKLNLHELILHTWALLLYHGLLFYALREPQPVISNVVNYLWPLLIIILGPLLIKESAYRWHTLFAIVLGCLGLSFLFWPTLKNGELSIGYGPLLALLGALTWSLYSVLLNRFKFASTPTALLLACLICGVLFIGLSVFTETLPFLTLKDSVALLWLGVGPFGLAFYFWNQALRNASASQIGSLSLLTPLLSSGILIATTGTAVTWNLIIAITCILFAAYFGNKN
ncbi:MAG: DMT family transporter [Bdellovibrionia bacterium]